MCKLRNNLVHKTLFVCKIFLRRIVSTNFNYLAVEVAQNLSEVIFPGLMLPPRRPLVWFYAKWVTWLLHDHYARKKT